MTVKELIAKLQEIPDDLEVWGFDYGDDQAYSIFEISIWHPDDELNTRFSYVEKEVVMLK